MSHHVFRWDPGTQGVDGAMSHEASCRLPALEAAKALPGQDALGVASGSGFTPPSCWSCDHEQVVSLSNKTLSFLCETGRMIAGSPHSLSMRISKIP